MDELDVMIDEIEHAHRNLIFKGYVVPYYIDKRNYKEGM